MDISSLISHRVSIEEGARAYEIITGDQPYLGVLLTYEEQDLPHERRILNTAAPSVRIRPDEILALGVLGAGNYALSTFLPVVKRIGGIAPVGIVSASGVSAHYAARRFGFGFAASEAETLLDDPVINMIAILTRHHLHSQQIQAAIQAGKHVYCEKPLAVNTEELKQIEQMLQGENRPLLTVGFNAVCAPRPTPESLC